MPLPERLGRYAVRRRIGSGGFATVWLAYDDQLDSPVAVKVLADNWSEDAHVRRRFVEEGRFLRRVDSPHVVSVYDAGELDDGRPYLVMTYADQGTLSDRVGEAVLDVWQGIDVVRQVGMGLAALHRRDVLHRDVKPGNVLFRSDDSRPDGWLRAMLGDLGLGKSLDLSSRLTMIAGTPSYVAPEQARGEALDPRADLFSLGALTYLVLTGRPPRTHASLATAAEGLPPPPLGTPDRPFPAAVEEVVARALDPDRERRWPDVASYVAALDAAVADAGATGAVPGGGRVLPIPALTAVGERPSSWPSEERTRSAALLAVPEPSDPGPAAVSEAEPARRRAWPLVLAGVLALVVGAGAAYAVTDRRDPLLRVTSETGGLGVQVPRSWETTVGRGDWTPPGATRAFPALSVGGQDSAAPGVFVGLMPAGTGPVMPGHLECRAGDGDRVDRTEDRTTVLHASCGAGVVVERVQRVTGRRWLWVQVRAPDRAQAVAVLDSVQGPPAVTS